MIGDNTVFWVIGLIIVFIGGVIVVRKQRSRAVEYVLANSLLYSDLLNIGQDVVFYDIQEIYSFSDRLKSKTQFDKYNYDKKMVEWISNHESAVLGMMQQTIHNRKMWKAYKHEVHNANPYLTKDDVSAIRLPYRMIHSIEKELCGSVIYAKPIVNPQIHHHITYTSPKGRNHYEQYRVYDVRRTHEFWQQVKKQEQYKQSAQYQRSLLTPSLRYDVLNRDHHKCTICGIGAADGAVLHVDHIKPVSKGGKTVMHNLRALCQSCNLGKSAKYNPNGMN